MKPNYDFVETTMQTTAMISERIIDLRQRTPRRRSVLVAISGIDGCGKSSLTASIADALQMTGLRVATINVDDWLNLPHIRFSQAEPAVNFYRHAIRFDAMFGQLVLPLRERRSLTLETDAAGATDSEEYHRHLYQCSNIDVILLEGIYLLKRAFQQGYYDLSVWLDCSFITALKRAGERFWQNQSATETLNTYRSVYFPAQQIHFALDDPATAAHIIASSDENVNSDTAFNSAEFGLAA